jgi:YidC/Oxa1 family membrane protein insertase
MECWGQKTTAQEEEQQQQRRMRQEAKEQMEKLQVILKFLPLVIGFFSLQIPAGLTDYWFTSNGFNLKG